MDQTTAVLDLAEERGIITAHDLQEHGLPRRYLSRLAERGELERVARGLYALPDRKVSEHHNLAVVAKRIPHGIVCLLSALRFHDLMTQDPFEVWLALPPNTWGPKLDTVPLRTVRMSGDALTAGIEVHVVEKVPVRVFSPAKTVADCFRFRRSVGLDVALEALRLYGGSNAGNLDELWRCAEAAYVRSVIRPYLEAIA